MPSVNGYCNERGLPVGLALPRLADSLPIGIFTCDPEGRILQYNRQCAEYWGREPDSAVRFTGAYAVYDQGAQLSPAATPMAEALSSGKVVERRELTIERLDGSKLRVEVDAEPIFSNEGTLIGGVCTLRDITKRQDTELQAARLAAIVASSDDAIIGKTLQGIVTSWNAGATRIFGYTEKEMIGQRITKIIPPELWSEEDYILGQLCRGEHIDHFETVRVAKDGHRIDVSVTVSPIRDGSGKLIGASKVGRDITERKQAQKVQELLISELNHRVKNTLATVQSIANQTIYRAKSPGDFASSFSGRLQALSKTHNLLTATTWRGAELSEIIRDQLSLDGAEDDRVSLSGPSVMLSPQATLHTGLVLHELATNAQKYGALSTPRGRLSLRWMVRTEGERKLHLEWQERGGPAVTVPRTRGFGSTLIERSLDAHDGATSIRYDADGVTCEIVLPLREVENRPLDEINRAPSNIMNQLKRVESPARTTGVEGKHILVVDDEPLIAMDIAMSLTDDGCIVVGPASTVEKALVLIETTDIDAALLDANLAGDPVDILAVALTRRKVPFAFVTGYGREGLPQAFRKAPLIKKPFERQHLAEVIQQLTAEQTGAIPLRKQDEPLQGSRA